MRRFSAFIVLVLFCSCGELRAQSTNASVTGYITDPNKAVIIDAKVTVINVDTNVRYEATTNSVGSYDVNGLPPGPYRIEVEKPGFKTVVQSNVILHVQDTAAFNFEMAIGSVSEIVTVEGGGLVLNTTDASVGTVVDPKFVENIPLNGRSFQDLISMTPGVVTQSPQSGGAATVSGDFSVNGQRTESNYYTVDGVSGNLSPSNGYGMQTAATSGSVPSSTVLGTTQSLVSVDALQEFRVQSSTYSAEYGRSPGGQFSLVTRSGTNDFHGSAFDYLRNDFFDANDWFNDSFSLAKSALRQNDFGGTLGGPFWIPSLYNGRDKTFFFVSYEGLRLTQPQEAQVQYVPDVYMREQAAAPLQPILNAFPLPTPGGIDYGSASAPNLAQFIAAYSLPSQLDSTSVRLDHIFNAKLSVFFRYGNTPSSTESRFLSELSKQRVATNTYTLGATSQLSSRMGNEFRLAYAQGKSSQAGSIDAFGGGTPVNLADQLGVGAYASPSPYFGIFVSGIGNAVFFVPNSNSTLHQWNVVEALSYSAGRHHFKVGTDYRRVAAPTNPPATSPSAEFFSTTSVLDNSVDFLFLEKQLNATPIFHQASIFAQDEWHIASNLNLSLGLRWEADPPPSEAHGNDAYTLLGDFNDPSSLSLAPRGTALWKTTWYNIAPRLGFAWTAHTTPGWETIVRAGGGVFFDTNDQVASRGFEGIGFTGYVDYSGVPLPITSNQMDFSTSVTGPPYTGGTVYAFPAHLQMPYTLQWNASVQQSFGKEQTFSLTYVGSDGRRLTGERTYSLSGINPDFGTVVEFQTNLTSSYNAMQLQFQRRVGHGLQALASYTWSHALDYGSNYLALPLVRGNSDFDVRHNFQSGFTWDLPGATKGGLAEALLNRWGLDARLMARTGFPVTLYGNYLTDPSTGSVYNGNPDLIPNQPVYLYGSQYPGGRAINPAAFQLPPPGQNGDAPRNFVRGFGMWQINIAVRREFPIYERLRLQFRAEAFNILNHPNFGYVDPYLTDATFGRATQMLNSSLGTLASQYQQGGPRSMQFALKLLF